MFLITDLSTYPRRVTRCADAKDVSDAILGITGSEETTGKVLAVIEQMDIGSAYMPTPNLAIEYVDNDEDPAGKYGETVAATAKRLLAPCVGSDFVPRIWEIIRYHVAADVFASTNGCKDGITDDDVALAIGRVIAVRLSLDA